MRCRKHLLDSTSTIGVCATCLHEKLAPISENRNPNCCNKSQPLIPPRSTSPCIRRRKSDQSSNSNSTITAKGCAKRDTSKSAGKFNLIAKLFRSKSSPVTTPGVVTGPTELTRFRTRGMSPENESRTRPSQGRVKQSPARLTNNVASFAFCLSPLVRASPATGRRYNWGVGGGETSVAVAGKGNDGGFCGGGGNNGGVNSKKAQIGETASYCRNRSRKVADFGRGNWNR